MADRTHVHSFGPFEESRFAGTLHRKCLMPGCTVVSLDADDDDYSDVDSDGPRLCPYCGRIMSEREAGELGACNDCGDKGLRRS